MLTNNGRYDLRPHLFLSWRAHLYFMYRVGSKVLVSKGALERKTKSYRDSWVNLHVLTHFFFPFGALFSLCFKSQRILQAKGAAVVISLSAQTRRPWSTGANWHTQGPIATRYPNRAYTLGSLNHLGPHHFTSPLLDIKENSRGDNRGWQTFPL